jgi:hypothetical protein
MFTGGDAPDDLDFRLIVLGIQNTCIKDADNAETAAKAIFEMRGQHPTPLPKRLPFSNQGLSGG